MALPVGRRGARRGVGVAAAHGAATASGPTPPAAAGTAKRDDEGGAVKPQERPVRRRFDHVRAVLVHGRILRIDFPDHDVDQVHRALEDGLLDVRDPMFGIKPGSTAGPSGRTVRSGHK